MNEAENDTPGFVRLSEGLGLAEEARACARHCKEGAWSPSVLQNEQGVRLRSAQVLDAAAAEIERLTRLHLAAIAFMRGVCPDMPAKFDDVRREWNRLHPDRPLGA